MFLGSEMRADAICLGQHGKDPNVGDGSDGRNAYSIHDRIAASLYESPCTFFFLIAIFLFLFSFSLLFFFRILGLYLNRTNI